MSGPALEVHELDPWDDATVAAWHHVYATAERHELGDDAARANPAYTLRSWVGPVPDDLLMGWAELTSSLATAPTSGARSSTST